MAKLKKLKQQNSKILKPCSNCFSPTYMLFNYSFICHGLKDMNINEKSALFDRICDLSKEKYLVVAQRSKNIGIEFIDSNQIKKDIPEEFFDNNTHRKFNNKFCVFRLYPNNHPTPGRVIGVFIKNIFYILYIDIKGEIYNH